MTALQLVYCSEKRALPPEGIFAIRDQARTNNAHDDVTGVLLFNRDFFMQCLEGDHEVVTRTFCRIASDPRHARVTLMAANDVEQRTFPDWSMGLVDSTSPDLRVVLQDLMPGYDFSPREMSGDLAVRLVNRMRALKYAY